MTDSQNRPNKPARRYDLSDLKDLRETLRVDAERREAERVAAEQAARRTREDADVFRSGVGQVSQLRARNNRHGG